MLVTVALLYRIVKFILQIEKYDIIKRHKIIQYIQTYCTKYYEIICNSHSKRVISEMLFIILPSKIYFILEKIII